MSEWNRSHAIQKMQVLLNVHEITNEHFVHTHTHKRPRHGAARMSNNAITCNDVVVHFDELTLRFGIAAVATVHVHPFGKQ